MVPERCRHEGEVLEVGVAVASRIVEDDQQEKLLDFDRIGRAVTLQDPTKLLVAALVFEVPSVGSTRASRQLAEVFLWPLLSRYRIPVEAFHHISGRSI